MTESEWLTSADLGAMVAGVSDKTSERKLRLFACACCRRLWDALTDPRSRDGVEAAERFSDGLIDREALRASYEATEAAGDEIHRGIADRLMRQHQQEYGDEVTPLEDYDPGVWEPAADATHAAGAVNRATVYGTVGPFAPFALAAAELIAEHRAHLASPVELDYTAGRSMDRAARLVASRDETATQAALLRDVIGNPFRPVGFRDEWRTGNVAALAQTAYADRQLPSGELNRTCLAVLADALEDAGCADAEMLAHLRSAGPHVRGCWAVDLILGKP